VSKCQSNFIDCLTGILHPYLKGADDYSIELSVTDASSLQVWLAQVPAWWEVEFALRTEVPNSSAKVQFFCPVSRF